MQTIPPMRFLDDPTLVKPHRAATFLDGAIQQEGYVNGLTSILASKGPSPFSIRAGEYFLEGVAARHVADVVRVPLDLPYVGSPDEVSGPTERLVIYDGVVMVIRDSDHGLPQVVRRGGLFTGHPQRAIHISSRTDEIELHLMPRRHDPAAEIEAIIAGYCLQDPRSHQHLAHPVVAQQGIDAYDALFGDHQ